MARGDHIYVERLAGVYAHHGINTGDGWVFHYTGKNWRDPSPDAVIDRAEARIGERAFSIIFHNCEHFSSWCKTGISNSDQVNAAWKATMSTPDFARYRAESLLINVFEPKWPGQR